MTIIFLFFLCICMYKTKFSVFNKQYIDRKSTIQINGIFVFLVCISHIVGYLPSPIPFSQNYFIIQTFLGQLVVTTFLFYSGYGVAQSIQKKGQAHIDSVPFKLLELIVMFSVSILLFVIVDIYVGRELALKNVLFSFVGWNSIGNSSWYLFDILALYLCSYISFKVFKNNPKLALFSMCVLSVLLILFLIENKPFERWYNTLICYVAGMIYSYRKEIIDSFVMKNKMNYIGTGVLLFIVFYITYLLRDDLLFYSLHSILFCLLICWCSMVLCFHNPILKWLGKHIFSIYILQRIPMILAKFWGWHEGNAMLFFSFSFISALLLAYVFDKYMRVVTQQLFHK